MPHGGHRSAPCVIAALAGFVHDCQGAAYYERNHDNDSYYGSLHLQPPFRAAVTSLSPCYFVSHSTITRLA
jgi:hypothetical protein